MIIRYHRHDTPCYVFVVHHQPKLRDGRDQYKEAVKAEAQKFILSPIQEPDVEVEIIYTTSISAGSRADVDNITWPTLDALVGIAFPDDRLVRSVTSTVFDKNRSHVIDGYVQYIKALFYTGDPHVVLIAIFSDSRLNEMGGEDIVQKKQWNEFLQQIGLFDPAGTGKE